MRSKGVKRQANYHEKNYNSHNGEHTSCECCGYIEQMLNYLRFSALYEGCFLPASLCS